MYDEICVLENNLTSPSNLQCISTGLPFLDFAGSFLVLIASIISLIAVIRGLIIIKELEMKGFDAICSFYAKLKSNLEQLLSRVSIEKTINYSNGYASAFIKYCTPVERNIFIEKAIAKNKKCFNEENWNTFKESIKNTINIFNSSDGQIPLSKNMDKNLAVLRSSLLEIDMLNPDTCTFNSLELVRDKHENFLANIKSIIDEIDLITPKLMSEFWSKIKKLK